MWIEPLRLNSGTRDTNSRAVESTARSIVSTNSADLHRHFDVTRLSRTGIVLVPRGDGAVSDFEADSGETLYDSLEALKPEELIADENVPLYTNLSTILELTDSESDDDAGSDIGQYAQPRDWRFTPDGTSIPTQRVRGDSSTPQPAAAYQYGRAFPELLRERDRRAISQSISVHILDEFELLALVVTLQLRPLAVIAAASRNLATRLQTAHRRRRPRRRRWAG